MNVLLDTHALLWSYAAPQRLSQTARDCILDAADRKWVSVVSVWEIAIKLSIGKLTYVEDFDAFVKEAIFDNRFELLDIDPSHASESTRLPWAHKDPFDRMLAAQARVEKMPLVSADMVMDKYGITRIW